MKFPDFSLTWIFFILQNVFPDRGNPDSSMEMVTETENVI